MKDFKKDFEEYLFDGYPENDVLLYLMCVRVAPETGDKAIVKAFASAPESMQWGVYVDFFDQTDIHIKEEYKHRDGYNYSISYLTEKMNPFKVFRGQLKCVFRRGLMRKSALESAIKIYEQ